MKSNKTFISISFTILLIGIGLIIWGLAEIKKAVVLIEWSTASELDTVGFNLYRSDYPEGPFEQINASLIPSSDDPLAGGQYQYEDKIVIPGKIYFYQLEDVEISGKTTRHGPIEVKAKSEGRSALVSGLILFAASLTGLILQKNPPKQNSG
ncbi:MAG: hypothetical protein GYA34_15775 [Chloroflexi bacterium]|nr:hypothetical protein [Chloroflexota bacterium]